MIMVLGWRGSSIPRRPVCCEEARYLEVFGVRVEGMWAPCHTYAFLLVGRLSALIFPLKWAMALIFLFPRIFVADAGLNTQPRV